MPPPDIGRARTWRASKGITFLHAFKIPAPDGIMYGGFLPSAVEDTVT
jgi:hypothetical protein